jgi:hypothetical protein
MKDFNRENGMQWLGFLVLCFILASATVVTGCSKNSGGKKGKSNSDRGRGSRSSNDGNDGTTDRLARARNESAYSYVAGGTVDFGFDLYTANGDNADAYYAGPVEVEGYLDYRGNDFLECGFTDGYYEIKENLTDGHYATDLAGGGYNFMNWQGARFLARNKRDGREAVIVIPSQSGYYLFPGIEIEDAPETVGEDGIRYSNTFWGEIIVESVEDIPCTIGYESLSFYFVQGSTYQPF